MSSSEEGAVEEPPKPQRNVRKVLRGMEYEYVCAHHYIRQREWLLVFGHYHQI